MPKPATNLTPHNDVLPRLPGESYYDWSVRGYVRDISLTPKGRKKGPDWVLKQARRAVRKQQEKHQRMAGLLYSVARKGDRVVSPGCGFGHEMDHIADGGMRFTWVGLELQLNLVQMGNASRAAWHTPGRTVEWDVYVDPLPRGDVLYLSHFCGGGTDRCIADARRAGYRAVVITTCCSHRFQDLSIEAMEGLCDPAEWRRLAKASSDKQSEEGREAQKKIDELRCVLLARQGYKVSRGWFTDANGNELPAGGWIVATKE